MRLRPFCLPVLRSICLAGALLMTGIPCLHGQSATPAADVAAMFHGGPEHQGVYPSGPRHWTMLWKYKTGAPVRSSPAVSGGLVIFGSNDRHVYALQASDGRLRWKFRTYGKVASSPAVVGGNVYFTDSRNIVYALQQATGKLRWMFAGGANLPVVGGWDFYLSSPAVASGVVYVGSGDGDLYALDAATGALRWKFRTRGRVHTSPAVDGGHIAFGSMDGAFYVLNRSGRLLWKYQTDTSKPFPMTGVFIGSPTIDGTRVFAGARDGYLYPFDLDSGKILWKIDEGGSWVINTPAVLKGVVYSGTSDTKLLQAIDEKTGKILWKYQGPGYVFSSPIVAGGQVQAAFWSAVIASFDLATGKAINGNGGEGPILSSPVTSRGVLYFGCDDGRLYAFE